MDTNSENTQEEQQFKERILVLEKKCKQLEEINAQYCAEDEHRLKQIDAIEEENKELKKDNAFKAKLIQQGWEENLQLEEALEEEQKKAEEMLRHNAVRIRNDPKASLMKSPSGASTSSSSSCSSSSTAGFNPQINSVVTGASSFSKHKFTRDFS
uniref:CCDC50_N domain-containing protein n=1 Tax=Globodera pallida TaxID=36090 RepID=A0A183BU56_GLOPA